MRVAHEDQRSGALAYLVARDVHSVRLFGGTSSRTTTASHS
jgi:hypothetical protein